ncbi:BTAD domain-containing putative transcriptional regulator [Actinosynnema sp. CS-041913]|uniref:AfsR/SARP family transcriptional regulator n=1 Tax=Actinosynnema sp. CS-041913 TaxID=3239917 RepID=UPI003D8BE51D
MATEFRLLGNIEAHLDGNPVNIGYAQLRTVLAVLLVEADRAVSVDQLVDRVWGTRRPPRRPRSAVQHSITMLRGALAALPEVAITWQSGGYRLATAPDTVDLHRFRSLVAQARATGDDTAAVALFEQALALWRGEPFAGLDTPWFTALRATVLQEHHTARLDLTDLLLRRGRHAVLLPELTAHARLHPLDERLAGQVILAYYRNGRAADALNHYRRLRQRLADELGTDPSPDLQQLFQQILGADPTLAAPKPAATAPGLSVPRHLPAPPRLFTGRTRELGHLTAALDDQPEPGGAMVISAIAGAGGIGKTWLALAWAHLHLDRFPDGQLFVDLHGFSPTGRSTEPADAVRGFLTALGVDPNGLPPDLDALAALYRGLVAGRRMLVVLDNAATADQVIPLLPGSPSCTVLVTGRHRLASLIDRHGAGHLPLGVLTRDEARALLAARIGVDRVAAEPDAAEDLVELCGGYPLALSITARNAATRPAIPLAEVAAELRELGLEMLDHDTDPTASLPTVLSWSLHRLTDEQRTVFGLLGIAPGADTTLPAVISLTALSPVRARRALSALEEASLVERRPHGRYAMHDLVRDYAATTAHTTLSDDVRETALERVMDFHLHTAHTADRLLDPHRPPVQPAPPAPDVHPRPLPDVATAMAWLDAEHATLLATQRAAVALGRHHFVWHLARALDTFHFRRGHLHHALASWRAALDAAAHLPDPTTHIRAHRHLGHACSRLGLHEEAIGHLEKALDLAVRHHDTAEQAHTHWVLAIVRGGRGDDRRGLDHARHALDLFHDLDMPTWEAEALNGVGWFAALLGDLDSARDHCHAALTLCRRHHDPTGEAATLDSLGFIAHRAGDHQQAVDHYHQALTLYRTLGHTYEAAGTLDRVGHPHAALGHHDRAREVWQKALELYREQGRDTDADRVRRQLDDLDTTSTTASASTS